MYSILKKVLLIFFIALLFSCSQKGGINMKIEKQEFGKTGDGMVVDLYTLINTNGMEAKITNYGAIVVSLTAPDRKGG